MKFKAKIKDSQLTIRAKFHSGSNVNKQELNFFSRKLIRGFFKPRQIKSNLLEYTGPIGITISDRLGRPISKHDFFFIIEQIVDNTQKLQKNSLPWNKVVWDTKYSYINEATKEIQLIYLPLTVPNSDCGDVMTYIERIIYSAKPVGEHDSDFVSRFVYFLRTLDGYDPQKIEEYIKKEDRDVVNTIKRHSVNSSGFMTDKRQDYYDHYSEKGGTREKSAGLLYEDDLPTGLLNEEDNPTDLLLDDEDNPTSLLLEEKDEEDNPTGLLSEKDDDDCPTGLLFEDNTHYPSLFRVLTEETISVNKPVFRIGKERSYVDYFVTNNNAVSRSHADIVTRGTRYFVVDLNSKNKTYINNQVLPVHSEMEIFDGDCLKLGNEEFIFKVW